MLDAGDYHASAAEQTYVQVRRRSAVWVQQRHGQLHSAAGGRAHPVARRHIGQDEAARLAEAAHRGDLLIRQGDAVREHKKPRAIPSQFARRERFGRDPARLRA